MPKNSMNTSVKIIGLAGSFASGKDSLARFLEEKYRIKHISTSDMVRKIAMERYGSVERPILYKTANESRQSDGVGVFSKLGLLQYEKYKNEFPGGVCINGFRAWGEAEVIKEAGGIVVFIDAPADIRYQRTVSRSRDEESQNSYEEFLERERSENGGVHAEYNLAAIKLKADIVIDNTCELEEFLKDAAVQLGLPAVD